MDNEQWDYVCYDKDTKEIITIVLDLKQEPRFVINENYVGIYIPHNEYTVQNIKGIGYFKNMNNVLYLDEYRNRYID